MSKGCDLYFWRQIYILIPFFLLVMSGGIMVAFPSILNPSILSANGTDIKTTADQASWIATSNALAGIVGQTLLPAVMQTFGRKVVFIILNLLRFIGWIIFVMANDTIALYSARIIQGFSTGCSLIVCMIISEYCHPKRRGYFLIIIKLALTFGVLLCHSVTICCTWRELSAFAISINALAVFMFLFCPESPSFLAMKGRFEECEASFLWIRGIEDRKEIIDLIAVQMDKGKKERKKEKYLNNFLKSNFWKPFLITFLLDIIKESSGRHYFAAYITIMMTEIVANKSLATFWSVGIDCMLILALTSACFVIRMFKRRTILFTFGLLSVSIMLLISFILFTKFKVLTNLVWLIPALVISINFISHTGLLPLCSTLIGEIYPLEHKAAGSFATGITMTCFYAITLKVTPIMMSETGLEGTFLVYGSCIVICLLVLYFILPETKDKTLQEIEGEMNGNRLRAKEVKPMLLLENKLNQ